jgi:hypothetical protein
MDKAAISPVTATRQLEGNCLAIALACLSVKQKGGTTPERGGYSGGDGVQAKGVEGNTKSPNDGCSLINDTFSLRLIKSVVAHSSRP